MFWSNRLGFVAEVDIILNTFNRKGKDEARSDKWNDVVRLLEDNIDEQIEERVITFKVIRTIVACVVILLWVTVGIFTFGWLWPPQIREWLFKGQVTSADEENSVEQLRFEEVNALREDLSFLQEEMKTSNEKGKSDLHALRDIANEAQTQIQTEMNDVKEMLNDMFDLLEQI